MELLPAFVCSQPAIVFLASSNKKQHDIRKQTTRLIRFTHVYYAARPVKTEHLPRPVQPTD